jgi:hypothetical protein
MKLHGFDFTTGDAKEDAKLERDLETYGQCCVVGGKHVSIRDVYVDPSEETLSLQKTIGDCIREIYSPRDHTQGPQASYRIHSDMLMRDAVYEKPVMRDCIEGCGKTFRIQDETEFRCESCKEKIRKMQLRVELGNALQNANGLEAFK